jgi:nucleotide-binding universal stress UspA family protein
MYKKILVPLDGSVTSRRGLREAIGVAREHGAELVLLHVVDAYPLMADVSVAFNFQEVYDAMRQAGEQLLAQAKAEASAQGLAAQVVLREVSSGRVADVVLGEAKAQACDLIVMGTHGRRGFSHLVLGSDAELVVRLSPLPVLLVRQGE